MLQWTDMDAAPNISTLPITCFSHWPSPNRQSLDVGPATLKLRMQPVVAERIEAPVTGAHAGPQAAGSSRRSRCRSRTRKCAEAADADAHRNVGLLKCADLLKAWRVVTGVCFTACSSCFLFNGSCGLRIFDVVLDGWHLFMLMCHCTRGPLIRSLNPSLLHSLRHSLGIAPRPAALLQIQHCMPPELSQTSRLLLWSPPWRALRVRQIN